MTRVADVDTLTTVVVAAQFWCGNLHIMHVMNTVALRVLIKHS